MSDQLKLERDTRWRGPRFKTETWTVEPFDSELELWALSSGPGVTEGPDGFYWLLVLANPSSPRCRSIPRVEGIDDIRWRLDDGRETEVVLGGVVAGAEITIEIMHMSLAIKDANRPVQVSDASGLLTRVCDRLKNLHFDDFGECESFERAAAGGIYDHPSLECLLHTGTPPPWTAPRSE